MKADVLVVGASPAGIMAATHAALAGARVILADGDLDGEHPANTLFEGMARRVGMTVDRSLVRHSLKGMRIISPAGHAVEIPAPGYFLDRRRMDQSLLRGAEKQGVELLEARVQDLAWSGESRLARADGDEIEARVVLDAAGVDSCLARSQGLIPMRHPEDVAWALEAEVEHPGLGEEPFFEYWIGSLAPGWKATFSPGGGDLATLGVFVRRQGRAVRPFFDRFRRRFQEHKSSAYPDIRGLKILRVRTGGDPIATVPGELAARGLMVTGGAAGQSGLAYGMRAGQICGEVAGQAARDGDVSQQALSRYQKLWSKELGQEYRLARASMNTLLEMDDRDIDALVEALRDKDLIAPGSLARKALKASLTVAGARPGVIPALIGNLLRG
ncbi:MAG: NAD(P)/FAD-dependent oxidoreductase [Methanosarcinales archaeon]|nr:NAD(P)/FAD-dependent oxidoreductase [Methanosarcinales archaeon]